MSEMMRVTYKATEKLEQVEHSSLTAETIRSFIQGIASRRTITVRDKELIVNDGFPTNTSNVRWESVFDGKELLISGVRDLQIYGDSAALLAQPQYAWVLTFRDCHDITLSDLTVGHTTSGYCQGGVIKFENCSGVKIRKCDLYGSGTYGLEFSNCSDIDVDQTTVRDCSYGILKVSNSTSITFTECTFANNREFSLCQFAGGVEQVMFRKCSFEKNFSREVIFQLSEITQMGSGLFVWDCSFSQNDCASLHDDSGFFSETGNRYSQNTWRGNEPVSWQRGPYS